MTAPLTFNVEQAAERIGPAVTVDWLKKAATARRIPCTRSGKGRGRAGKLAFTEAHLAEILLMIEQRPEPSTASDQSSEFDSIISRGKRAS